VRDHALAIKDNTPKSDVNKEYYLQNLENKVSVNNICMYMYMYVIMPYLIGHI
jgi:hypothetical protein